jgi:hypothetical protein
MEKSNTKITANKRQAEFDDDFTVINDNLFCRFCNEKVDYKKADTINKHLKSLKHKDNKLLNNKSILIPQIQSQIIPNKKDAQMIEELIIAFIESNIPIEKID